MLFDQSRKFLMARPVLGLGLMWSVMFLACSSDPHPRESGLRPNILIVVVDTLRRDHLGTYGYSRPTSPRIDDFANSAVVFDRAYAQSPSTKPSIASLFTSTLPSQHGTVFNEHALADHFVTLAEVFDEAGYQTAGFGENPIVGAAFNFDQGFDEYQINSTRHNSYSDGAEPDFDEDIHDWLSDHAHEEFMLLVHYVDPHSPYWAPEPYRGRFAQSEGPAGLDLNVLSSSVDNVDEARAKYDEEILYIDQRFGGLLDQLDRLEIRDETIVVFLSDHGEEFGEHGQFHHSHSVYSELVDIPLIISPTETMKAGRRSDPVQHIDLYPTLLDLAGISNLNMDRVQNLEGQSLIDAKQGERHARGVISEHLREGWGSRMRSVVSGHLKLVEHLDSARLELFDLAIDRGETVNRLETTPPADRDRLMALLQLGDAGTPAIAINTIDIDLNLMEELRLLGYVPEHDHHAH